MPTLVVTILALSTAFYWFQANSVAIALIVGAGATMLLFTTTFVLLSTRRREQRHRKAAAEIAETIREVISSPGWRRKLDPLEWALVRTRVAQLDLVDLSHFR
ncbi:hypothetical protein DB30_04112 [Enhygromyxa salina]|uniref:Uncharacterized protein n=1 Tax=Enhygromyxa salina TaxID=215803 RepID=A0A0C2A068_9BACT|nr:hypothetical protein DB30_04112 [Enhygromyxa salina]